jgi:hypothetical protein
MQNDENEKKKSSKIKKKNPSPLRLTRSARHLRHEIRIKKIDFKKKDLVKKTEVK